MHVELSGDGRRRVREVLAVPGRVEDGVVETATVFRPDGDGALVPAGGYPPHEERFRRAGFDVARAAARA